MLTLLLWLWECEQRPPFCCRPFAIKSFAIFLQQFSACGVVEENDVLCGIDAYDHDVVQFGIARRRFQRCDQWAAFLKMLAKIVPCAGEGESLVSLLLKVPLHRRRVDPMGFG